MISLAGNVTLIAAMVFSSLVVTMYSHRRNMLFLSNVSIAIAFALLLYAFINSDFSVRNVFLNSSTIKPLIYKIAGSWASHEGSMLLYLTLLSTMSSVYAISYRNNYEDLQLAILAFIQLLFLLFIYFTSNPFDHFKFTPDQGLGLNPALQDKALSIHPPLLYIGYASYVATYVNGILLLLRPQDRKKIIANNICFSSFALMCLTAGIGLGSWWAYRELGWGGYWFFDPVENISLMPWLVGIALHHFLLRHRADDGMIIITSILPFLLTIYGIFFVRSGIISSVHSFAFSVERGLYLFVICVILTVIAIGAGIWRVYFHPKNQKNKEQGRPLHSGSKWITIGNVLWLTAFVSLFISLIYPLYYSFIYNIDVAIDPEYFHKILIPIFIPIILLAAIAPFSKFNYRIVLHVIFSALILLTIYYFTSNLGIISGLAIFTSMFLMTQMLDYAYIKSPINMKSLSLIIGHFSLGALAFSIALNVCFSKQIEFIGKIGDVVSNDSFVIKLNDIKFADGTVYYRQIAEFMITDPNGNIVILKPENRLYKVEKTLSQESDIYSYLTHDMFAVLSKIDGNIIHAIVYYRPMIYFIWLSIFLMTASFFINLLGKYIGKIPKNSIVV